MLLVAGRKRVQLALPVGSRSFRHFCGKDRMVMMVRMKGEERNKQGKERKGKERCASQIAACTSSQDPVIALAIQSAFFTFDFGGDAALDTPIPCDSVILPGTHTHIHLFGDDLTFVVQCLRRSIPSSGLVHNAWCRKQCKPSIRIVSRQEKRESFSMGRTLLSFPADKSTVCGSIGSFDMSNNSRCH